MIATADLYWVAGFLEGEGAFMALHNRPKLASGKGRTSYWVPVVDASQVNREPLERLTKLFGGILCSVKGSGVRQDFWNWRLNGRKGIALMMTLWTLMSKRRRDQIALAIERWKSNPGTQSENYRKSRARGEESGTSKLTEASVVAILASADSNRSLAIKYGVSPTTIHNVRHRRCWAHIPYNRTIT